jgi:hypothetical protein
MLIGDYSILAEHIRSRVRVSCRTLWRVQKGRAAWAALGVQDRTVHPVAYPGAGKLADGSRRATNGDGTLGRCEAALAGCFHRGRDRWGSFAAVFSPAITEPHQPQHAIGGERIRRNDKFARDQPDTQQRIGRGQHPGG